MAAVGAEAVELKLVGLDGESVPGSHVLFKPLDLLVLEFHDFPAAGADQMVVVALVGDIVVLRLGAEVPGLGQTGLAEQVQRAVDGRQPDVRVFLGKLAVHLLRRDVLVLKECLQNVFALAGQFELMLGQMLFEGTDLFGRLVHVRPDRHGTIKNQIEKGSQVEDDGIDAVRLLSL